MAYTFIPKGQEGLLLRDPLTFGFSSPSGAKDYKPLYSKQFDQSQRLDKYDREALLDGTTPRKVGFYTRNNPHPVRVRHIKGLLDAPICFIEDNTEARYLMSAPSGQDLGPGYYPPGSTRFSARGDLSPAVGVVPVTFAWRDELEKKANNAINKALGQPLPSRGGGASRGGARLSNQFDHVDDDKLLDLLCRILQTDSIPACQAWLKASCDSERTIVLNMIRMAASGDIPSDSAHNKSHANDSDVRYTWAPEKSQSRTKQKPSDYDSYLDDDDFKFSFQREREENNAGLYDVEDTAPFKFPENDTVIKTARQLSNLASRQGSRGGNSGGLDTFNKVNPYSKDPRSPSRNAQLAMAQNLSKATSEQLQSYLQKHSREKHSRSASLSGPVATRPSSRRPRSRSATAGSVSGGSYPPAPVKVSVTKERIRAGEGGSAGSSRQQVRGKMQYTSHWGSH